MDFGPKNESEARIFSEEALRVDVQVTLHSLIEDSGLTREQVAYKLGWRIYQLDHLFSDYSVLKARDIAAICYVLGYEPVFMARKKG